MRVIKWNSLFLIAAFWGGACDGPVTEGNPIPPGEVVEVKVGLQPVNTTIIANVNVNTTLILDTTTSCVCGKFGVCQTCSGQPDCTISNLQDGTACTDDGNMCTSDVCSAGVCTHSVVKTGTTCSDGNLCTTGDTCSSAGTCAGTPVTCAALDQCHVAGACDPTSGSCTNPTQTDGTTCNDSSACTSNDSCQSGVCTGKATVCTASDQCHAVGTCDPASGTCSNPAKANGSTCDDSNACTAGDTCQTGVCTAGTAKTCTAIDQCHAIGTCDPTTGTCSNPNKSDGASCDADGSKCTPKDTCVGGVCTKDPSPVVCVAKDCNTVACDPTSGNCTYTPAAGTCGVTGCSQQGTCSSGVCSGTPKDCSSLNTDCQVGVCNATNGNCAASNLANGTACATQEKCLASAACENGTCTKTPVVCPPASSLCKVSACDPTSGACAETALATGAACDTSNPCMSDATCNAQGQCSGTPAPNGTACTDSQGAAGRCAVGNCAALSTPDGSTSGPPDAATTDATATTDAAAKPDAASAQDASSTTDAGSAGMDAATTPPPPPPKASGCCEISPTPMPGAPLLFAGFFALLLIRKGRRSGRR